MVKNIAVAGVKQIMKIVEIKATILTTFLSFKEAVSGLEFDWTTFPCRHFVFWLSLTIKMQVQTMTEDSEMADIATLWIRNVKVSTTIRLSVYTRLNIVLFLAWSKVHSSRLT